mgnify:FL=1
MFCDVSKEKIDSYFWKTNLCFLFQLFNMTIENSEKSDDLPTRLEICLRETTLSIYKNVARLEHTVSHDIDCFECNTTIMINFLSHDVCFQCIIHV